MPGDLFGDPSLTGGYLYAREFALAYKFVNGLWGNTQYTGNCRSSEESLN